MIAIRQPSTLITATLATSRAMIFRVLSVKKIKIMLRHKNTKLLLMTNKKIALHFIIKPSPIGTYPNFWRSYSSESEA